MIQFLRSLLRQVEIAYWGWERSRCKHPNWIHHDGYGGSGGYCPECGQSFWPVWPPTF